MDASDVAETLDAAEQQLGRGETLAGSGFWRAVRAVKEEPALVDQFADQISEIDTEAHNQWALLSLPLWLGNVLALAAIGFFIWLVGRGYQWAAPWNGVAMIVGAFGLMTSLHSPAHLLVGRAFGIQYTKWFIGEVTRPQPGVKIKYSTYLRTPPKQRAIMHAAGAVVSKLAMWLTFVGGFYAGIPTWALAILGGASLLTTTTDIFISRRSGDWMKAIREYRFRRNAS
jgi:hypothetical protein